MWPEDRRVKVMYVDENYIFDAVKLLLGAPRPMVHMEVAPEYRDLVADLTVVRVTHSWDRRAFGLLVHHPSFDPVPDGDVPPYLNILLVTVRREDTEPCVVESK